MEEVKADDEPILLVNDERCLICTENTIMNETDFCDICHVEMKQLNLSPQEYAWTKYNKEI